MRIVGIDPGSRKTGFGLIDTQGTQNHYLHSGFWNLGEKAPLAERLLRLSNALDILLEKAKPDCASIEKIFFAKNAQSALTLGHARGVILLKLAAHQIPIYEYTPTEIKQSVVGVGRASKDQVEYMVRVLLNERQKEMNPDESDALAIAITHAHRHQAPSSQNLSSLQSS